MALGADNVGIMEHHYSTLLADGQRLISSSSEEIKRLSNFAQNGSVLRSGVLRAVLPLNLSSCLTWRYAG